MFHRPNLRPDVSLAIAGSLLLCGVVFAQPTPRSAVTPPATERGSLPAHPKALNLLNPWEIALDLPKQWGDVMDGRIRVRANYDRVFVDSAEQMKSVLLYSESTVSMSTEPAISLPNDPHPVLPDGDYTVTLRLLNGPVATTVSAYSTNDNARNPNRLTGRFLSRCTVPAGDYRTVGSCQFSVPVEAGRIHVFFVCDQTTTCKGLSLAYAPSRK